MSFEEDLIAAVKNRPAIYDRSLSDYKNNNARENAWEDVAMEIGRNDTEVLKKRWRSLRDAFIKYHRLEKCYSSLGQSGKKRKWVYYDEMLFLIPYIEHKESTNNYEKTTEVSQMNNSDDEVETQISDLINTDRNHINCSHVDSTELQCTLDQQQNIGRSNNRKAKQVSEITKKSPLEAKLLEVISKPQDSDEQFLLSCLPILKRLPPRKNLKVRSKILSLLYDIEFWDNYELSDVESTNLSRPSSSLSTFKTEPL